MSSTQQAWATLAQWTPQRLTDLVEQGGQGRLDALVLRQSGIRFDWTKTHLDDAAMDGLCALADAAGLDAARRALFAGDAVNVTEHRAAEHCAQRGEGAPESVAVAHALHDRMRALIEVIDAGGFGDVQHILHIGIGGSALGPDLLIDALGRDAGRYDIAVVSNVDGAALKQAVKGFDPHKTLIAVASKTFTTTETLLNAKSALEWMADGGVDDAIGRIIALTAMPDRALEWGVDETRILPFQESVGGRYSLWSSIGFPIALAVGYDKFAEFLDGAAAMDRHFLDTDGLDNLPLRAAFADLYYTQLRGTQTRACFAYDERLRLLPSYLQQLEM
ncbi:MAG: glucose-6-phosphate isomerase, partial [Sphingopyxis sp.]